MIVTVADQTSTVADQAVFPAFNKLLVCFVAPASSMDATVILIVIAYIDHLLCQ